MRTETKCERILDGRSLILIRHRLVPYFIFCTLDRRAHHADNGEACMQNVLTICVIFVMPKHGEIARAFCAHPVCKTCIRFSSHAVHNLAMHIVGHTYAAFLIMRGGC